MGYTEKKLQVGFISDTPLEQTCLSIWGYFAIEARKADNGADKKEKYDELQVHLFSLLIERSA
jgi:hypothetical protein